MPRRNSAYNAEYEKARRVILAGHPRCHRCGAPGANSADHVPALWQHRHIPGSGCCVLKPAHLRCNVRDGGWRAATKVREARKAAGLPPKPKRRAR